MKRMIRRSLPILALFALPLLRLGQAEACTDCHSNTGKGAFVHAAVELGCDQCHVAPHADAAKPVLSLKTNMTALCAGCHEQAATGKHITAGLLAKAHPVQGKVSPLKKGAEFSCVTCHEPHKSAHPKLMVSAALSGPKRCAACHQKVNAAATP
ncbi:MAG: cytochrome c3 family protein [Spirochaetes bacterium]|nr:cytochrome c3 family protein [Spirochaetota bacterium]